MGWHSRIVIQPGPAQLTISGGQPGVQATQHRIIQPGPANLTIIGSHPAIGTTLMPGPANLTITGGQPKIDIGTTVTPGAAALTIAGGQPIVVRGTVLTPAAAALTISGGQPTVTVAPPNPSFVAASTTNGGPVAAAGVITDSITPGAGERTVFAWMLQEINAARGTFTVTCDGTAMTEVGTVDYGLFSGYNHFLTLWAVKKTFTAGAKTISMTSSAGGYCTVGAHAYQNAGSWTLAFSASGAGTAASMWAPGSANQMVMGVFGGYTTTFTGITTGTKTQRINKPWSSGQYLATASADSIGSSGLTFTSSNTSNVWGGLGVAISVDDKATWTQIYTRGALATVTNAAYPTGWLASGTGVYVKGIGSGGTGQSGGVGNTGPWSGGAGGAGFDEVFVSKATLLAAHATQFSAQWGQRGNDGTATANTFFKVGTAITLQAGGANVTTVGAATITGVAGVTSRSGAASGANSAAFAGAGGGASPATPYFSSGAGTAGGSSPTKSGGAANGGAGPDADWLQAGPGGGGGNADTSGGSSVGTAGGRGGKYGGGGGAGGNGWSVPGGGGLGGDGGLSLRWV